MPLMFGENNSQELRFEAFYWL